MGLQIYPRWDCYIARFPYALNIWFSCLPSVNIIKELEQLRIDHPGVECFAGVQLFLPGVGGSGEGREVQLPPVVHPNSFCLSFPPTFDTSFVAEWIQVWLKDEYGMSTFIQDSGTALPIVMNGYEPPSYGEGELQID